MPGIISRTVELDTKIGDPRIPTNNQICRLAMSPDTSARAFDNFRLYNITSFWFKISRAVAKKKKVLAQIGGMDTYMIGSRRS